MSISDGFIETSNLMMHAVNCASECELQDNLKWLGGDLVVLSKTVLACLIGLVSTDGVGVQVAYMLWLLDLKPQAQSLCSSNLSACFTQGAPSRK